MREPLFISLVTTLALAAPVAAATPPAPTIVDVFPTSTTARTGSTLVIDVIAENKKSKASRAYALNFLISKSKSASGARKIGAGTIPSIPAKKRKSFSFSLAIPSNADTGSFRLLLCHPRTGEPLLCHEDSLKLTITLAPAKIVVTPSPVAFGNVRQSTTSDAKHLVIRNAGRLASGPVSLALSGSRKSDFQIVSHTCTTSLAANATCTADLTFTPSALGAINASLKVTPAAKYGKGATVAIGGKGATPAKLVFKNVQEFGSVAVGETSPVQTVTLTNDGGSTASPIDNVFVVGPVEERHFVLSADTCTGVALAPAQSCTIGVQFRPNRTGTLSNALKAPYGSAIPATIGLTGTGTQRPPV